VSDGEQNEPRDQQKVIPRTPDANWRSLVITLSPRFAGRTLGSLTSAEVKLMVPDTWMALIEQNWDKPIPEEFRQHYRAILGRRKHDEDQLRATAVISASPLSPIGHKPAPVELFESEVKPPPPPIGKKVTIPAAPPAVPPLRSEQPPLPPAPKAGPVSFEPQKLASDVRPSDEWDDTDAAKQGSTAQNEKAASAAGQSAEHLPGQAPSNILQSLYGLFNKPVLIPIPRGQKKPVLLRWQNITYEDTLKPEYQKTLIDAIERGGNLGIRLGVESGRLFALDIDDDGLVAEFLERYPWLSNTLQSRGKRGRQFWFRLEPGCDYPNDRAIVTLRRDGKPYGELRLGGGRKGAQSIIFGIHPTGTRYENNGKRPMEIGLAELYELTGWSWYQRPEGKQAEPPAQTASRHAGDRILQAQEGAGTLEAQAEGVAKNIEAFYDQQRKEYVLRIAPDVYQSRTETQFKRTLRFSNLRAEMIPERNWSQIDMALRYLQENKYVSYVGGLSGKRCGFYEENGVRILVTSQARIIEPSRGEWPTLNKFFSNLLAGPTEPYAKDQLEVFYGWMKVAVTAQRQQRFQPGQALAIAGPMESGKSLLQGLITQVLGGRSAKAALFLQGRTDFNSELFEAEHLMLEDEAASSINKDRQALAVSIKNIIANRIHPCHQKNRPIVNLAPWWRLSISLNDRPERLLVLPPLTDDVADKIILLRASCHPMPMPAETPEQKELFWKTLTGELPAFIFWLLNEHKIIDAWRNTRFGIRAFHHPLLLTELEELSPAIALLGLIDQANIWDAQLSVWEGTALDLRALLLTNQKTQRDAGRLLEWINACGQYLGDLARMRPARVKAFRSATRRWFEIYGDVPA
jgi:hypothetical protein